VFEISIAIGIAVRMAPSCRVCWSALLIKNLKHQKDLVLNYFQQKSYLTGWTSLCRDTVSDDNVQYISSVSYLSIQPCVYMPRSNHINEHLSTTSLLSQDPDRSSGVCQMSLPVENGKIS